MYVRVASRRSISPSSGARKSHIIVCVDLICREDLHLAMSTELGVESMYFKIIDVDLLVYMRVFSRLTVFVGNLEIYVDVEFTSR